MFESKETIQTWSDCGDDFYYGLNGEEINYELAVEFYQKASKKKHPHATFMLGVCHELGVGGLEEDPEAAEALYEKAAKLGDEDAEHRLETGEFFEPPAPEEEDEEEYEDEDEDEEEEVEYEIDLEMEADFHIMTADELNEIGIAYEQGVDGRPQDPERAFQYYLEAAEKGSALGKYNVGCNYYNGTGTEQDYDEAEAWFLAAAEDKDTDVYHLLATIYHNGYVGDEPDYADAIYWYDKAAKEGTNNPEGAQEALFALYSDEESDYYDLHKALYWLQVLAKNGNKEAQRRVEQFNVRIDPFFLGGVYYNGHEEIEKDEDKACFWLETAAQEGNVEAMNLYASLLLQVGDGEADSKVAAEWFQRAIEAGDDKPYGMVLLGNLYEKGEGVEKDYNKALYYYDMARNFGDEDAEFMYTSALRLSYIEIDINTATGQQLYQAAAYYHQMEGDENKALEYMELAAIRNYSPAFYQTYGFLFMDGKEGSERMKRAFWWLNIAANDGNRDAIEAKNRMQVVMRDNTLSPLEAVRVANRYKDQGDDIRARYWYNQLAILSDSSNCAYWAGYYYFHGRGTLGNEKHYDLALKWLLKAADLGDKGYQEFLIAKIYLYGGHGVERNYKEAVKWYERAISADKKHLTEDHYRELAYAYIKLGDERKAEKYQKKADKF